MAYIKDTTNLLANPGLLPQVRNDVTAVLQVITFLKNKHFSNGPMKNYIIRRYISTINGVLEIFPGCKIDKNFEPTRRPWFIKAMKYPDKTIITKPYLDVGGAGYILTISHTIFKHNIPIAVVSIDLTYSFFYKILLNSSEICQQLNYKCFLIEDNGFLIGHPIFLESLNRRQVEHITHKESFIANELLNHKILVEKKNCLNYLNETIERFYNFNMSLDHVLSNIVHGERTKYQIILIPKTNIFLSIVKSSSDGGAFCPCSTVNRLCLNCNRMEQTDCECPCECPIIDKICEKIDKTIEICPKQQEITINENLNMENFENDMKTCFNVNCQKYLTQFDCIGIIGCEWCQIDIDGENLLNPPFCTIQTSCFNGVLGSTSPYDDGQLTTNIITPIIPAAYSAFGPVAGAIITLCLVVGFAMYCYRQNLDSGSTTERLYTESIQENFGLQMQQFDYEINSHDNKLLSELNIKKIPEISISPYRISTNYRRPNGDSDHGYSTMTPHEDSEHLYSELGQPIITNRTNSDTCSINTSISMPSRSFNGTFINEVNKSPYNNLIIAPVTVHRNMEAS